MISPMQHSSCEIQRMSFLNKLHTNATVTLMRIPTAADLQAELNRTKQGHGEFHRHINIHHLLEAMKQEWQTEWVPAASPCFH